MNLNEYQNYHETKSHTVSEFPYNTYLCSIPLDFVQVPLHWHQEFELIVIKKGKGAVSVDLHRRGVSAGDIVFIRPGQLHAIEQEEGRSMEYENIIFKIELLSTNADDLCARQFFNPLMEGTLSTESFFTPSLACYGEMADCFKNIDLLCSVQPEGYQLAVKGFLFRFFYLLISYKGGGRPAVQTKTLKKLKQILKYVEEYYPEPMSIDDMAALTYYSKSHFMKFFKLHMGTSFIDYLNDYRLTMAEKMLRVSDASLLDIAAQNGFENLSYFNRMFKRKYGCSPGKWRNLHLRQSNI